MVNMPTKNKSLFQDRVKEKNEYSKFSEIYKKSKAFVDEYRSHYSVINKSSISVGSTTNFELIKNAIKSTTQAI